MNPIEKVEQAAAEFREDGRWWIEPVARFGYAAKGVVYILIGLLAFQASIGSRDPNIDSTDVLLNILTRPYGRVMLVLVAAGLIAYAVWRLVQALLDPERRGRDLRALVKRTAYLGSAIAYAGIASIAVQLVLGTYLRGTGSSTEEWTAWAMALPAGRWVVGIAGLGVIIIGIVVVVIAINGGFMRRVKTHDLDEVQELWARRIGSVGIGARGAVIIIIGIFVIQAAATTNPEEVGGLGGALAAIANQPYGRWLLAATAVGLVAYGLFTMVLARYRELYD